MNYKEYNKIYIGETDVAGFIFKSPNKLVELHTGSDGAFDAYLVDGKCDIPRHYSLWEKFNDWLWIYDDTERTAKIISKNIEVYTAGKRGILIKVGGIMYKL